MNLLREEEAMLTRWGDFDRTFTTFTMLDELRRRMDRLWDEYDSGGRDTPTYYADYGSRSAWPRINVFDTGAALVVHAEVPGLADKDVQLTMNQDVLTLKGERKPDAPEGYSVHRQERAPVRFSRSVTLPMKVDAEKTTASLKNGILTITLPKAPEAQPRQISVVTQ
jgi:HSP20 family protein